MERMPGEGFWIDGEWEDGSSAYDPGDPKRPGYYDRWADAADRARKREREQPEAVRADLRSREY